MAGSIKDWPRLMNQCFESVHFGSLSQSRSPILIISQAHSSRRMGWISRFRYRLLLSRRIDDEGSRYAKMARYRVQCREEYGAKPLSRPKDWRLDERCWVHKCPCRQERPPRRYLAQKPNTGTYFPTVYCYIWWLTLPRKWLEDTIGFSCTRGSRHWVSVCLRVSLVGHRTR